MSDKAESNYEVGYKRPPEGSQFRKGTSGNPKGRPRYAKNLATLLDEALEEKVPIVENGKRRRITKRDAMVKQLVNRAASGDLRAAKQLTDLQIRLNPKMISEVDVIDLFRKIAARTLEAKQQMAIAKTDLSEAETRNE